MFDEIIKYFKISDIVQILLAIIFFSILLNIFFVDTLKITSSSMEKTLLPGDFVLVNKFYYDLKFPGFLPFINHELEQIKFYSFGNPKKGDIIAFYFKKQINEDNKPLIFVKRCIAGPGDSVYFNGEKIQLPKRGEKIYFNYEQIEFWKNLIIKDGSIVDITSDGLILVNNKISDKYEFKNDFYFLVGDNLSISYDSRNFGPVPRKDIIGKVILVYWSMNMQKMTKNFFNDIRWNRLGMLVW